MSETYSAMVERIMRDNFAKFALEYERKMYEPPDFLRRIQEEERQKMRDLDTIYHDLTDVCDGLNHPNLKAPEHLIVLFRSCLNDLRNITHKQQKMSDMKLTDAEKHHMVVRSLDSLSAKIEALEKTNYADRVQGRFINGEFDGIKQRIKALENPPRKEAEDAAQRLWERAIEDKLAGMHYSISQLWEKVHSKDVKPDAPESVADAISRAADKHLELSGYPPEPKRPKYEYDIIRYNSRPSDEEILEKLNDFGFSGWELVLVKDWTYFIRREIIP